VLEGEFRPGGTTREFVDAGVLRQLRRRSLARLRREVEAVEPAVLGRFAVSWHAIGGQRSGPDALLDVIEQLQGAPLPASLFEYDILGARLGTYSPDWLDTLAAAGEVRWIGLEPLGHRDGRIALYLTDQMPALLPDRPKDDLDQAEQAILQTLSRQGASFFAGLHEAAGGGFPGETVDSIWQLVWRGLVTNDTFFPLRAFTSRRGTRREPKRRVRGMSQSFRSRRAVPQAAEGRWTVVHGGGNAAVSPAERLATRVRQLLSRHGVLTREALASEGLKGGFSGIYPALKAMDDAGRVRRGYFVAGLGATQFALPGALDLLRSLRDPATDPQAVVLAATDPANAYGTSLPWPAPNLTRTVGTSVILVDGEMAVHIARGQREITVNLPDDEPFRARRARAAAAGLIAFARGGDGRGWRGMQITTINDQHALDHPFAPFLEEAGFLKGGLGFYLRRPTGASEEPENPRTREPENPRTREPENPSLA
jgi:ATP-dependent Lhr-like helicase